MLRFLKKHMGYFAAYLTLLSPLTYAGIISHNVLVEYVAGNHIGGGSCCGMYSAYMEDVSWDGSAISATMADTLQYTGLSSLGESDTMTINYDAQNDIN